MGTDVGLLLARDHEELERSLVMLIEPWRSDADKRSALDDLCVGFVAHAEGQSAVLWEALAQSPAAAVRRAVIQVFAAHEAQESVLTELRSVAPSTARWHDLVQQLRDLLRVHSEQEDQSVLGALRAHIEPARYQRLAGAYATERLRALGMLHPMSVIDRSARRPAARP
ncbi:MAG: hypothetical protein H0T89_29160 [Deltaproteobacteria bacterium]|nr:hypothetical protein [Deltaproteobacteria bacterium]MDQ3300449.1 hypothetical protein [Myxococcota bacterium]